MVERRIIAQVDEATRRLVAMLSELANAGIELHDAGIRRPSLDDVFLTLTGHGQAEEVAA